jgi:hypothetical protein
VANNNVFWRWKIQDMNWDIVYSDGSETNLMGSDFFSKIKEYIKLNYNLYRDIKLHRYKIILHYDYIYKLQSVNNNYTYTISQKKYYIYIQNI